MLMPLDIKALENFRIWIRYENGSEGEVDLADLAGRGVFNVWNDYDRFTSVHIAADGAISWGDDIELCPDAIYLRLTRNEPEDVFPSLKAPAKA